MTICDGAVSGCRAGQNGATPAAGERVFEVAAEDRDSLYFELGGIFDYVYLTSADRAYLAKRWGYPHWHWTDSALGDELGTEDGLEDDFAQLYNVCAWGRPTTYLGLGAPDPPGVSIPTPFTGSFDTCKFIRYVARRDSRPGWWAAHPATLP
jgi:hypothetical protein